MVVSNKTVQCATSIRTNTWLPLSSRVHGTIQLDSDLRLQPDNTRDNVGGWVCYGRGKESYAVYSPQSSRMSCAPTLTWPTRLHSYFLQGWCVFGCSLMHSMWRFVAHAGEARVGDCLFGIGRVGLAASLCTLQEDPSHGTARVGGCMSHLTTTGNGITRATVSSQQKCHWFLVTQQTSCCPLQLLPGFRNTPDAQTK